MLKTPKEDSVFGCVDLMILFPPKLCVCMCVCVSTRATVGRCTVRMGFKTPPQPPFGCKAKSKLQYQTTYY